MHTKSVKVILILALLIYLNLFFRCKVTHIKDAILFALLAKHEDRNFAAVPAVSRVVAVFMSPVLVNSNAVLCNATRVEAISVVIIHYLQDLISFIESDVFNIFDFNFSTVQISLVLLKLPKKLFNF